MMAPRDPAPWEIVILTLDGSGLWSGPEGTLNLHRDLDESPFAPLSLFLARGFEPFAATGEAIYLRRPTRHRDGDVTPELIALHALGSEPTNKED